MKDERSDIRKVLWRPVWPGELIGFGRSLSLALALGLCWLPSMSSQTKLTLPDSCKMNWSIYFADSGKLELAMISRCTVVRLAMRCLVTVEPRSAADHHVDTESIIAENFVYSREPGTDWVATSFKTMDAISPFPRPPDEELKRIAEFVNPDKMQLVGSSTHLGRKTKILRTIKPFQADSDVLAIAEIWVSVKDNSLTRLQIDFVDPETQEIDGRTRFDFYGFNHHIVVKPPIMKESNRAQAKKIRFDYEPCTSGPTRACDANEFAIRWDAREVKNVAGVILTREDDETRQPVRLPTSVKLQGQYYEKLCGPTTYHIVGINKNRQPLRKTADSFTITRSNLIPCK